MNYDVKGNDGSTTESSLFMKNRSAFNERKATQVASRFLSAAGRKMPYISLLKLMYFADREALKRWGTPITNDQYYSLDHGPILSTVKNLIVEEARDRSFWSQHISSPSNYLIELIDETDNDQLSSAEENLIDEIFAKYKRFDRWALIDESHKLPEWKHPNGSSVEINIDEILAAVGTDPDEIGTIVNDLESLRAMQALSRD